MKKVYTSKLKEKIQSKTLLAIDYLDTCVDSGAKFPISLAIDKDNHTHNYYVISLVIDKCMEDSQFTYDLVLKDVYGSSYSIDLKTFTTKSIIVNAEDKNGIMAIISSYRMEFTSNMELNPHKIVYKHILMNWSSESDKYPAGFKLYLKESLKIKNSISHLEKFEV